MRRVRFGRTGVEVPAVSVGTWPHGGPVMVGDRAVGWTGHDDELAREALVRAFERGLTHWDTADVYGNGRSEELIGSLWDRVDRDRVFLASKVGWDPGPYGHYYHPDQIRSQLERSLRNLRTDRIDVYYLHHCDFGPDDAYLEDAVALLRESRDRGTIRLIGLSDWDCGRIVRFADRVQPDVVQPYRNVVDDGYESSGLRRWVERNDAGVAFFSPLKHGLLLGKYARPTTFGEGDHRTHVEGFRDERLLTALLHCRDAVVRRFQERTQPNLHALLGVILSDAPTGCALVGLRNPDQVEAAATAGQVLSDEDAAWVRRLFREAAAQAADGGAPVRSPRTA